MGQESQSTQLNSTLPSLISFRRFLPRSSTPHLSPSHPPCTNPHTTHRRRSPAMADAAPSSDAATAAAVAAAAADPPGSSIPRLLTVRKRACSRSRPEASLPKRHPPTPHTHRSPTSRRRANGTVWQQKRGWRWPSSSRARRRSRPPRCGPGTGWRRRWASRGGCGRARGTRGDQSAGWTRRLPLPPRLPPPPPPLLLLPRRRCTTRAFR